MSYKVDWFKTVLRMMKCGTGFSGSADYWETRYVTNGHSGEGSYGRLAEFKAEFLNDFVQKNAVKSVLEFGCGDGNQLKLANYPFYTGIDISQSAIDTCRRLFLGDCNKEFLLTSHYDGRAADLVLSLDVIYHLVEDDVFESYIRQIFTSALRHVIIYSSNSPKVFAESPHVRHRDFSSWVAANETDWKLTGMTPNRYPVGSANGETSFAHFFIYERNV